MQTQVFDLCVSRYDSLVDTNWGALSFTEGEWYVCGFVFVDRHSPFLESGFNAMQMVLEIEGCRCRIGVSRNYCRIIRKCAQYFFLDDGKSDV